MSDQELELNNHNQELELNNQELELNNQEPLLSDKYEIIIDCPPFKHRPDEILEQIIQNTDLLIDDFIKVSTCFGAWTFKIVKNKESNYLNKQKDIGEKLTKLYNIGSIRYAEW